MALSSEAVSFLRARGYREVTSKVYPKMRHEILNETGREDVWRDLLGLFEGLLVFSELLLEIGEILVRHLRIRILIDFKPSLAEKIHKVAQTDVELF